MSGRNTGKQTRYFSERETAEHQHPHKTYLFFAIVGSSILFLSIMFMYMIWLNHNSPVEHFKMPKSFMASTVILLISSFSISHCLNAYKEDETKKLLGSLAITLFLAVSFLVLQVFAWISLFENGYFFDGEIGFTFIYIVSGLHFVHVLGGILYLLYLNFKAFDNWNDPVKALLYFSNKYEQTRLELFSTYWHFVDVLWMLVFFTFLFTM